MLAMANLEEKMKLNNALCPVDINFTDLTYTVPGPRGKGRKTILNKISGEFKSGELTAIMGASGAGKSSLLNILTGFITSKVEGKISIGNDGRKNTKLCSYILQEDRLFPFFTVQETMLLAASLKISDMSLTTNEKKILVENILSSLGLSHTKKIKCSNLSGGQRKRLSIALELLDNPPVLFLDEPTTGLDSSSTKECINLLRYLAAEGRTLVCTIHQPSAPIFNTFAHIYVLSEGNCVYQGAPTNVVPFLATIGLNCPQYHNPADFLLEVTNKDYGDYTQALCKESEYPKWREVEKSTLMLENGIFRPIRIAGYGQKVKPPSEWIKLWYLVGRYHVLAYRDWTVTHLKLVLHILCAIIVGLLFGDSGSNAVKAFSNIGLLLIGIVYIWYTTFMPSVLKFPLEISTIKKETFNNWYKLRTYYLATQITATPIHVLFSISFGTLLYVITSQPLEIDRFFKYILIFIVVAIAADGFGILLGTLADPINGTFLSAVISGLLIVFAGFLILLHHMPFIMQLMTYMSPIRYAFHNLVLAMYDQGRSDLICPSNVIYCHFKKPSMILQTLGITNSDYTMNTLLILITIVIIKTVSYFTLRRAVRKA